MIDNYGTKIIQVRYPDVPQDEKEHFVIAVDCFKRYLFKVTSKKGEQYCNHFELMNALNHDYKRYEIGEATLQEICEEQKINPSKPYIKNQSKPPIRFPRSNGILDWTWQFCVVTTQKLAQKSIYKICAPQNIDQSLKNWNRHIKFVGKQYFLCAVWQHFDNILMRRYCHDALRKYYIGGDMFEVDYHVLLNIIQIIYDQSCVTCNILATYAQEYNIEI